MDFHVEVGVVDKGGKEGNGEDLDDGAGKPAVGFLPAGDGHVSLDEEAAVDAADDAQDGVGNKFEAVPVCAVLGLVEDELAGAEGVECLQRNGGGHGADEALPHGFVGKVV